MFAKTTPQDRLDAVAIVIPSNSSYGGVETRIKDAPISVVAQRAEGAGTWPVTVWVFDDKLTDLLPDRSFVIDENGIVPDQSTLNYTGRFSPDTIVAAVRAFSRPCDRHAVAMLLNVTDEIQGAVTELVGEMLGATGGIEGSIARTEQFFTAVLPDFEAGHDICRDLKGFRFRHEPGLFEVVIEDGSSVSIAVSEKNGRVEVTASSNGDPAFFDTRSLGIALVGADGAEHGPSHFDKISLVFDVPMGQEYTVKASGS